MSKNSNRYKEDYSEVDEDVLDELDIENFEKFHSKKSKKKVIKKSKEIDVEELND